MRLALLGLGLIGGSIARALHAREPGRWTIAAWSPAGTGPAAALADGAIERVAVSVEDAVREADLVVIAAPPLACLALLGELARLELPASAIVTDVASTKRRIAARADELRLPFVGGHPMAGREASGYDAADADLFVGRPWVITATGAADPVRVEALATAVGAVVVRMDPVAHDAAVSAVSHLPLVVSAALVEAVATGRVPGSPDWGDVRPLAAGGWASMTRLARGDAEMGAGILSTNADNVAERLRVLRQVLDEWLTDLEAGDHDTLRRRLELARDAIEPEQG